MKLTKLLNRSKSLDTVIEWQFHLLNALFNETSDLIYLKDCNSRFLMVNSAMTKKFSLTDPEQLIGKTDFDFFCKEHAQQAFNDEQLIIRTGIPIIGKEEMETWFNKPISWVSTSKYPLFDDKGKIIGTYGISREITENKRIIESVQHRIDSLTQPFAEGQNVSFEDLFNLDEFQKIQDEFSDATGVASITTKPDGSPITKPSNFTRFCNDIVRKTELGCANCYKSDSKLGSVNKEGPNIDHCLSGGLWDAGASIVVSGYHIANWMIGQVRDESQNDENIIRYAKTIGVEKDVLIEAFHEVPSMSEKQFRNIAKSLFSFANLLSQTAYNNLLQARLISEQKLTEVELLENQEKLKQLNLSKDKFFSIIAHDLRTPFNSIIGFCDILKNRIDNQDLNDAKEFVDIIFDSSKKVYNLLVNLLEWSRTQTGAMDYNPAELDVDNIINETVSLFTLNAVEKSLRISIISSPGIKLIADKAMLSSVLRNLISNAIKFSNTGGLIKVSVTNRSEDVLFTVEDNGVGIKESDFKKVFDLESGYTTKGTKNETGSGLGLILCKEFVEKHNGKIWIESVVGEGSSFKFTIPI